MLHEYGTANLWKIRIISEKVYVEKMKSKRVAIKGERQALKNMGFFVCFVWIGFNAL